ncbi:hypothetical protein NECAME_16335 [Necator americanus]|uniref:Uncharacterized protein n=1 Tax=Necator americanus TaxID=51031 RepID=W2TX76_NECAM|nr:hypothetical protein NECAME_16335 [Necator americanus]ETN86433.1 hypothetical protein NECAME_16335 [Necator americanus]
MQLRAEAADTLHHRLVASHEEVVAEHRRHGHAQTDGGHDERFTDRARDLVDRSLTCNADGCQRVIDAPHRTEQADERRGRAHGTEERQAVLQPVRHIGDGALDRNVDPRVSIDGFEQRFVVMLAGLDRGFRDEPERRRLIELLCAFRERRCAPEPLIRAFRAPVGAELLEELGDHDVPAAHRHHHEQQEHKARDKVAVLPERAETTFALLRQMPAPMWFKRFAINHRNGANAH